MENLDKKKYYKTWYEDNKNRHNKYMSQLITCSKCGSKVLRSNMTGHKKTLKHINYKS